MGLSYLVYPGAQHTRFHHALGSMHLMAQAIKELHPEAQFFVGPVVSEGFYYDFKLDHQLSDEDLPVIEKKMKDLAGKKFPIKRKEYARADLEAKFANDPLKEMVLKNIIDDTLTTYTQGDFEDLCRGPHVPNTRMIRSFKLIRVAGAYLGGDEENEMITRIYGISFFDKAALKEISKPKFKTHITNKNNCDHLTLDEIKKEVI